MLCYSLKMLGKLEEAEEKKNQIKEERVAAKAAASLSYTLVLAIAKANLLAKIKVPLLLLKDWAS
jgi:hypothetical protein